MLNGKGAQSMLGGKDYWITDVMFQLSFRFGEKLTTYMENWEIAKENRLYSELLFGNLYERLWDVREMFIWTAC